MMLGMSLSTFTQVHVIISLIGIVSGFIVMFGFRETAQHLSCSPIFAVKKFHPEAGRTV